MTSKLNTFQHSGEYICKCGRKFDKSQSLNAHKSHCIEHLGKDKFNYRIEQQKKASKKATKSLQNKARNKANELQVRWDAEEHFCERCGKRFYKKIGSGRFCSVSCSNKRDLSLETKKKIALGVNSKKTKYKHFTGVYNGYYFQSSYELIFLVYCLDNNIKIERNTFTFTYLDSSSKEHIYLPDWYLPETNTIVECKGRGPTFDETINKSKIDSVDSKFNYQILYEEDLQKYWEYCKKVYGVSKYAELCEKLNP